MKPTSPTWTLVAAILASSMAFIDSSALNVALPAIQRDLAASGAELLWVVNAYLLVLAALILPGGSLGDRFGRKRVFMVGIALFLVGSLACGLAPTIGLLIAARLLQGLGGALMIPGSLALIGAAYDGTSRGRAIGTWSAASTLVTLAAPALGGVLADAGLWRGVFLINVPLGLVALAILATRVPESRDEEAQATVDVPGALLVSAGLAGVTYGALTAPDAGLTNLRALLPLVLGVVALIGFVVVEGRSAAPMMPLGLFRSRTFSGTNLLTLLLYGALSIVSLFLSLNLVQAQGYSQAQAGLAFLPFALTLALLSRRTGGLADRFGPRALLVTGPLVVAVGFVLLGAVGQTAGPDAYWTTFLPGILVFAIGMALVVAPLTAAVIGAVPSHAAGTASGINNAVSRAASVLAIAIVGALALLLFRNALLAEVTPLGLSAAVTDALAAGAGQLGALKPPADLTAAQSSAVADAVRAALVQTYQTLVRICAGLAALSALSAWVLVEGRN